MSFQDNSIPGEGEYAPPPPRAAEAPVVASATPPRTRISTAWVALIGGAIAVILLLVFVLENSTPGDFAFLGMHFTLPLGVAVLLAAVCGVIVTAIIGTARIHQIRQALRRPHRAKRR